MWAPAGSSPPATAPAGPCKVLSTSPQCRQQPCPWGCHREGQDGRSWGAAAEWSTLRVPHAQRGSSCICRWIVSLPSQPQKSWPRLTFPLKNGEISYSESHISWMLFGLPNGCNLSAFNLFLPDQPKAAFNLLKMLCLVSYCWKISLFMLDWRGSFHENLLPYRLLSSL